MQNEQKLPSTPACCTPQVGVDGKQLQPPPGCALFWQELLRRCWASPESKRPVRAQQTLRVRSGVR